jgi:hypothetical protein
MTAAEIANAELAALEAKIDAHYNAMTQEERDAEQEAYEAESDRRFCAWAEASSAASFGLTLTEYRESRGQVAPDPAMWNERDAEAHFGPNPYK